VGSRERVGRNQAGAISAAARLQRRHRATRGGLASGATATEAGCRALPDGLWVGAGDGRRECLRHAAAGLERGAGRTALVYIPGDAAGVAYRFAGGRPWVEGAGERYEATSAEARRAAAEALSDALDGGPVG
jgi:hypothetical protein